MKREAELDRQLDRLNSGLGPDANLSPAVAELVAVARLVSRAGSRRRRGRSRLWVRIAVGAAALALVLGAGSYTWRGVQSRQVVFAMDEAVAALSSYHGILAVKNGNAVELERMEVWSAGANYAVQFADGTRLIFDGERWYARQGDQKVMLRSLPAATGLEIRREAANAAQFHPALVGKDQVGGREALKLRLTPPGGSPYYLWVDAETHMPVKLQTVNNRVASYAAYYIQFEANVAIDPAVFR